MLHPYIGNGPTYLAADGRRFIGYYMDEEYIESAWKRP
jgi:hypothetical protein